MNNIIGYVLGGKDISAQFFDDAPDGVICPSCHSCLDYSYVPRAIKIRKSDAYGIGNTSDHRQLFSGDLVEIIKESAGPKFDHTQVSDNPLYFYVTPHEKVSFDLVSRGTKFGRRCELCGTPREIIGATPAYLECDTLPENGFFWTNIEFGSTNGKFPLFIVGKSLKEKIESKRLRGIYFMSAFGRPERRDD